MKNKICIVLLLLLFPALALASSAQLTGVQFEEARDATHITFNLSQRAQSHVFSLTNPKRIIIDFDNTRLGFKLQKLTFPKRRINAVREGYPKAGTLRIVLDVNERVQYQVKSKPNTKQVKIDLLSRASIFSRDIKPVPNYSIKPMVIVIDPGHGGKDPGAIGQHGTREKDVVLSIAKILADLINRQPNMRAVLTRDGDYFVSLRNRLKIARKAKADLFIAIHADSYFNTKAAGASVYALSNHGATSLAARWLAQRENHSELGGVNLDGLEDQSTILRSVLLDLAQTATNKASLYCGSSLLDALNDVTKLHYSRVEKAPFMVLKSPDIPSLLVETGFISNIHEENRLRNKKHQYKMAAALFAGVHTFKNKYLAKEA